MEWVWRVDLVLPICSRGWYTTQGPTHHTLSRSLSLILRRSGWRGVRRTHIIISRSWVCVCDVYLVCDSAMWGQHALVAVAASCITLHCCQAFVPAVSAPPRACTIRPRAGAVWASNVSSVVAA